MLIVLVDITSQTPNCEYIDIGSLQNQVEKMVVSILKEGREDIEKAREREREGKKRRKETETPREAQ